MRHPTNPLRGSLAIIVLLVLAGCASAPTPEAPEPVPAVPEQPAPPVVEPAALPETPWRAVFEDAEDALGRHAWMSAEATLAQLPSDGLDEDDRARRDYLLARSAYARGDLDTTDALLQSLSTRPVHPAIAYRVANFRRHVLSLGNDHLSSARLGAELLERAPTADRPALKRSVWRDLQQVDLTALRQARDTATEPAWSGWLALALLARDQDGAAALTSWREQYPDHSADSPLPGGLDYVVTDTAPAPRVALLLPLSGRLAPAGKAVRDGFLAGYFRDRQANPAPGELLIIDTDRFPTATAAYNEAVTAGAGLVVGPLRKEAVAELATLPLRPVPVLALNRIDSDAASGGAALVQLSLAPEDEAAELAELAFGKGHRRALILRPAGAWGDDMQQALRERWQALGGSTAAIGVFTGQEEYSGAVKEGLDIAASEQRRRVVADMLASPVEFTPRRRQDIDAVFLLARNGAEARALKPLLAFHYAGGLPVFAPSSIYGGKPDPRDRDLDGIRVVEIPWLLGADPTLAAALADMEQEAYPRLQALGTDAYRVQSHFGQLRAGPDALLRGNTGLLSLNPRLQIIRDLSPAAFDGPELQAAR